jgi:accessory gene regulator protein AgrB
MNSPTELYVTVHWLLVVPIAMISIGVFLWIAYTPAVAEKHRVFGEKHKVGRGLSARFHLFLARVFSAIAIGTGAVLLILQMHSW